MTLSSPKDGPVQQLDSLSATIVDGYIIRRNTCGFAERVYTVLVQW